MSNLGKTGAADFISRELAERRAGARPPDPDTVEELKQERSASNEWIRVGFRKNAKEIENITSQLNEIRGSIETTEKKIEENIDKRFSELSTNMSHLIKLLDASMPDVDGDNNSESKAKVHKTQHEKITKDHKERETRADWWGKIFNDLKAEAAKNSIRFLAGGIMVLFLLGSKEKIKEVASDWFPVLKTKAEQQEIKKTTNEDKK